MINMYYRYEMHCHDNVCSGCAVSSPEDMVSACAAAGYSGMVFTNHFLSGNTAVDYRLPWEEKIDWYYNACLRAREAAPKGFTVMFGLEHRYGCTVEELLTYGLSPQFLKAHPDMHLLPVEEYIKRVHEGGGIVIQAHPFRFAAKFYQVPLPATMLDGIESHNLFTEKEENIMAEEYARKYGILESAGGDIHNSTEQLGQAGLAFPYPINSEAELVAAFKKGDGRRIMDGKIELTRSGDKKTANQVLNALKYGF